MADRGLRILELRVENVKRLKAVMIRPGDRAVVAIQGKNGAGKSSVLDSIVYALGGKHTHPAEVIRRGAAGDASVVLDLGDYVVERRWESNEKSTLLVRGAHGQKIASPQRILDELVGRLSFDPLAFSRMEPRQQAETLRALVGLDTADLDAQRAALVEERTRLGRDSRALGQQLLHEPAVDAPEEEVDIAALLEEQRQRQAAKNAVEETRRAAERASENVARAVEQLADLEAKAERLRAVIQELRAEETRAAHAYAMAEDPDVEEVTQKIARASETNRLVQAKRARRARVEQIEALEAETARAMEAIAAIDAEKKRRLEAAAFPVPGLSVDEGAVTLNDLPLEVASQAEQIRVSVAIGLALNPRLRIMLIRDGSLLDTASLELLSQLAGERDAQVWLERVEGDDPTGVVIEDGMVASPAAAAAASMP